MKKVLFGAAVLILGVGLFAGGTQVLAFTEGDESFLPGGANADQAGYHEEKAKDHATVEAKGVFEKWDNIVEPTDPGKPVPGGDNKWINVLLPKTILFGSTDIDSLGDGEKASIYKIYGPIYSIKNQSIRAVEVGIRSFKKAEGQPVDQLLKMDLAIQELTKNKANQFVFDSDGKQIDILNKEKPEGGDLAGTPVLAKLENNQEFFFTLTGTLHPGVDFNIKEDTRNVNYQLTLTLKALDKPA